MFEANSVRYVAIARQYQDDAAFRARMEHDPRGAFRDHGISLPGSTPIQVHANSDDTWHFVFPPDPNVELSDESLGVIAAGDCVGSASTIGCLSTVALGTTPSTMSTFSSSGTASTK
jgi:hypothetical protein